mgnify:CR=1 FL=1
MTAIYTGALPTHGRFDYQGINKRTSYRWPNGAGLAVYVGFNIEHFAFGEGLIEQSQSPGSAPLVMGIALHPYIIGQPYRLRHLRRALQHVAAARDRGQVWMTTPGAIFRHAVRMVA